MIMAILEFRIDGAPSFLIILFFATFLNLIQPEFCQPPRLLIHVHSWQR